MASRSYSHLRAVFDEYKKLTKRDIEQAIVKEMSGDIGAGMLTIGMCMYIPVGSVYTHVHVYMCLHDIACVSLCIL